MTSPWNGGPAAPRLLAHRGASLDAPENTLAAFDLAVEQGANGLEVDVHLTRDGVPVLVHDPSLARTGGIAREVRTMTLAEVQQADVGTWHHPRFKGERVPTLEAVLARYPRMLVNVEVKVDDGTPSDALVANVLKAIEQAGARERVLVSCFDPFLLGEFRDVAPDLPTGAIVSGPVDADELEFLAEVTDALMPEAAYLTQDVVDVAHDLHIGVFPWTVNDTPNAKRLFQMGVDGIITDAPERLRALVPRG